MPGVWLKIRVAHTQQAFTDTPKKQQNNDRRCSDFDYNQSYALS